MSGKSLSSYIRLINRTHSQTIQLKNIDDEFGPGVTRTFLFTHGVGQFLYRGCLWLVLIARSLVFGCNTNTGPSEKKTLHFANSFLPFARIFVEAYQRSNISLCFLSHTQTLSYRCLVLLRRPHIKASFFQAFDLAFQKRHPESLLSSANLTSGLSVCLQWALKSLLAKTFC